MQSLSAIRPPLAKKYLNTADAFEASIRAAAQLQVCYSLLSHTAWNPARFQQAGLRFAVLLAALASEARHEWLFRCKPKLHMFLEQSRQKVNPALIWTYRDESFGAHPSMLDAWAVSTA